MTDKVHRKFSEVTSQMISRARQAEQAANSGDIRAAKAELGRTMINLVSLFGILDED